MSRNCIKCVKNDRTGFDLLCDSCRRIKMNTPEDAAGTLTEKIMIGIFSASRESPIIELRGAEYNRVYDRIYRIVKENVPISIPMSSDQVQELLDNNREVYKP